MDESVTSRTPWPSNAPAAATEPPAELPDYAGANLYVADPVLGACLDGALDPAAEEGLRELGAYWGSTEAEEVARLANAHPPNLRRWDVTGHRIDQVELHPAYHALLNRCVASGLISAAWEDGDGRSQHRVRAATLFLAAQCERGHLVPISASHAAVAALAYATSVEDELYPLLASRQYDRRALELAEKTGATVSLAIAEREPTAQRGAIAMRGSLSGSERIRLDGEKWLVASPNSDMLLVLAETPSGPTAAMVPRFSAANADALTLHELQRGQGLASQAIATVAFDGAEGIVIGEPGRGPHVLRDVRTLTQLDLAIIAAGAMRATVARAAHHARYHMEDGRPLIEDPLTARVIADMALHSAAASALALRTATAFDQAFERDGDHAIARLVTPAARFQILKGAPGLASDACDLMGANAFLWAHPAARIQADLATLSAFDGASDVAAIEAVRLVERDGQVLRDAVDELAADLGPHNADLVDEVMRLGERAAEDMALARAFGEQLAMLGAASAMRRNLPRVVSDAYVASRLRERYRTVYGAVDGHFDAQAIIDFIVPEE